jgi:hypothetical protein
VLNCVLSWLSTAWNWTRVNDLPNWFAVAFTLVFWPLVLILWQRRKVNGVPGLEVHFVPGEITIGERPFPAISVLFTNHTGSVVYISGVRIRACKKAFPVPIEASRDRAENSYHLKFIKDTKGFAYREITLQTTESGQTCMPISEPLPEDFYRYWPSWLARRLRRQKYFVLAYTAVVGTTRHSVATLY